MQHHIVNPQLIKLSTSKINNSPVVNTRNVDEFIEIDNDVAVVA